MSVPLWRDRIGTTPEVERFSLFGFRKSGLKRVPAGHARIDTVPRVDATQRAVRIAPFAGIEAIALIDKGRGIAALLRLFAEYRLSPITVSCPFVQHQDTREVGNVPDFRQHAFRKIVKDDV